MGRMAGYFGRGLMILKSHELNKNVEMRMSEVGVWKKKAFFIVIFIYY